MAKSIIKNSRKVHAGPSTDPSLDARVYYLENNEYKVTYYEVISGASGTLTVPTSATINEGEFGSSGNAILSEIDVNQKPTFKSPQTAGGVIVTASLDAITGAWLASGIYTSANVALIYSISILAKDYQNLNYDRIVESEELDYDLASQAAVDTGTANDQIVTPKTLANYSKWLDYLETDAGAYVKAPFYTTTLVDHSTNTIAASSVYSQLVPAGTLKGGDILRVQFKLLRVSGTGSAFIRIYNTTSAGSLGTRIAQNSSTTGGVTQVVTRNFRIAPDGLSMSFISGAIAFSSDEVVNINVANESAIAFDVNVDQYFSIGIEKSVGTDVYRLYYVYSQVMRA